MSANPTINTVAAILGLLAIAEPLAVSIAADIATLSRKYPQYTPEQLVTVLVELSQQVQRTNEQTRQEIEQDRKEQP